MGDRDLDASRLSSLFVLVSILLSCRMGCSSAGGGGVALLFFPSVLSLLLLCLLAEHPWGLSVVSE